MKTIYKNASDHGFMFSEWLYLNQNTGYAIASLQAGGYFIIPPTGKTIPSTTFKRVNAAMRQANQLART